MIRPRCWPTSTAAIWLPDRRPPGPPPLTQGRQEPCLRAGSPALSAAVGAVAGHGESVRVYRESVFVPGDPDKIAEHIVRDLGHGTAFLADQVPMCGGGEVVGRWPAAHAGAVDDPEPFQFFEVAVDRRQVHIRRGGMNLGGQFLSAAVIPVTEQGVQQQPPRGRGPPSVPAHQGEHILNGLTVGRPGGPGRGIRHHAASIGQPPAVAYGQLLQNYGRSPSLSRSGWFSYTIVVAIN